MKTQNRLFSFFTALALVSVTSAFAQSPPQNDNFVNRTTLTGSSVTFSGSLAGATLESAEATNVNWRPYGATASVWWTWTAAATGPVVISMPNPPPNYNVVNVYTGADFSTLILGRGTYFAKPLGRYLPFRATAG